VLAVCFTTHVCVADIWQWADGDGNGTLWLSDSVAEPYTDLSGQVLWWAELPNANLHHATLVNTDFSFANLFGANLKIANLSFANLFGANLEESILAYANFFGADLESANINDANMFYANFSDANLANLENWESAFWLAARYNANTIFPEGMNPDEYAMIELEVPAPGGIAIVLLVCITNIRRRRISV
jgi:hypothetical protein